MFAVVVDVMEVVVVVEVDADVVAAEVVVGPERVGTTSSWLMKVEDDAAEGAGVGKETGEADASAVVEMELDDEGCGEEAGGGGCTVESATALCVGMAGGVLMGGDGAGDGDGEAVMGAGVVTDGVEDWVVVAVVMMVVVVDEIRVVEGMEVMMAETEVATAESATPFAAAGTAVGVRSVGAGEGVFEGVVSAELVNVAVLVVVVVVV